VKITIILAERYEITPLPEEKGYAFTFYQALSFYILYVGHNRFLTLNTKF